MKKINMPSLLLNTLFYTGIVALVLYAVAGIRYFAMPLTSMEPRVKKNSLLILRYSSKGNVKVNDIILVEAKKKQVNLYEVSSIEADTLVVANNDGILNINLKQVLGREILTIPVIGVVVIFLKTKWGLIIGASIILLYIAYKKILK